MAHYEQRVTGDLDAFAAHLDQQIAAGSISANVEDTADLRLGSARTVVRVYERYSAMGGNRVSLNVSVLAVAGQLAVSAITSGGSQAVFWKLNTFGEEAFLRKAVEAIEAFPGDVPGPS
jgi:hypothetical protein